LERSAGYTGPLKRKELFPVIGEGVKLFLFFVAMVLAFAGVLYIRAFFTKKAIFRVIEIFYQRNAVGINGAKTLHELGLEPPDFFQRITRRRDYKQYALQILIRKGFVLEKEDGKVYLAEERLDDDLRRKRDEPLSY
jgi:hypothetical protein